MNQEKYKDDLRDIREMMARSSRFISLSGISGIFAGIYALIAAVAAYKTVYDHQYYLAGRNAELSSENMLTLILIAAATCVAAIATGIFFTTRENKKKNQKLWDAQTRKLLISFAIPLATGGLFCLVLLNQGNVGLVAPATLIFYGLALVNASKYTMSEIRSLGILEVIVGLCATAWIGYGLIFWAIGFGVLHIVYGIWMHNKK